MYLHWYTRKLYVKVFINDKFSQKISKIFFERFWDVWVMRMRHHKDRLLKLKKWLDKIFGISFHQAKGRIDFKVTNLKYFTSFMTNEVKPLGL